MQAGLIPNVSVDCVVFGFDFDYLNVLLVERHVQWERKIYIDLKLPGDLVRFEEDLYDSAIRILNELTGLENIFLKQFNAFGAPGRINQKPRDMEWLRTIDHPEERVITIAYYSLINLKDANISEFFLKQNARWIPLKDVKDLAFDHNLIIQKGLDALRNELKTRPIGFELLPEKFTLTQLQKLYEVVIGTALDKRNFRKKIEKMSYVVPINEKQTGVAHKPARLYMFSRDIYEKTKKDNFDFTL